MEANGNIMNPLLSLKYIIRSLILNSREFVEREETQNNNGDFNIGCTKRPRLLGKRGAHNSCSSRVFSRARYVTV